MENMDLGKKRLPVTLILGNTYFWATWFGYGTTGYGLGATGMDWALPGTTGCYRVRISVCDTSAAIGYDLVRYGATRCSATTRANSNGLRGFSDLR